MINKNTQKNTNVSTGTKTESSVYLKKSDLSSELVGKSISSFKNDMGYISASSLDAWLKSHSYLSKNEITKLISDANLVVVDSISMEYSEEAVARLDKEVKRLRGEIVAIKNRLTDVETGISSIDFSTYATKTEVNNIDNKITNIQNNIPSVEGLASKEWVEDQHYLTEHQDLSAYLEKSELPSNLVSKSDLNSYATKTYVTNTLKDYAKKEDVPSIDGLASKSELSNYAKKTELGRYATTNSLNVYAKKTDLSSYAKRDNVYTKDQIDSKDFLTRREASHTYTTQEETSEFKKEVARDYLKIEDYRGVRDAIIVINTEYKDKTYEDLLADKDKLINGFYIIKNGDQQDMVVLKNHEPVIINNSVNPGEYGYALESWVDANFAKKSEIPGLKDELKSWVEGQGYLTEHQDISGKADKSELPTKVSELENDVPYLTEHQDISGKVDRSELNDYVQKSALTWRVI